MLENLIKDYKKNIQKLRDNLEITHIKKEIRIEMIEELIEKPQIELNHLQ